MKPSKPPITFASFLSVYHPQTTVLHDLVGLENVVNIYGSCKHWTFTARRLLGDCVPYHELTPPVDQRDVFAAVYESYVERMSKCVRDYVFASNSSHKAQQLHLEHKQWMEATVLYAEDTVAELIETIALEVSLDPRNPTISKSDAAINALFYRCCVNAQPITVPIDPLTNVIQVFQLHNERPVATPKNDDAVAILSPPSKRPRSRFIIEEDNEEADREKCVPVQSVSEWVLPGESLPMRALRDNSHIISEDGDGNNLWPSEENRTFLSDKERRKVPRFGTGGDPNDPFYLG